MIRKLNHCRNFSWVWNILATGEPETNSFLRMIYSKIPKQCKEQGQELIFVLTLLLNADRNTVCFFIKFILEKTVFIYKHVPIHVYIFTQVCMSLHINTYLLFVWKKKFWMNPIVWENISSLQTKIFSEKNYCKTNTSACITTIPTQLPLLETYWKPAGSNAKYSEIKMQSIQKQFIVSRMRNSLPIYIITESWEREYLQRLCQVIIFLKKRKWHGIIILWFIKKPEMLSFSNLKIFVKNRLWIKGLLFVNCKPVFYP